MRLITITWGRHNSQCQIQMCQTENRQTLQTCNLDLNENARPRRNPHTWTRKIRADEILCSNVSWIPVMAELVPSPKRTTWGKIRHSQFLRTIPFFESACLNLIPKAIEHLFHLTPQQCWISFSLQMCLNVLPYITSREAAVLYMGIFLTWAIQHYLSKSRSSYINCISHKIRHISSVQVFLHFEPKL